MIRYKVDHQDWCHWETHGDCCATAARIPEEDYCDCGAAEIQGVIDRANARLARIARAIDRTGDRFGSLAHANDFLAEVHEAVYGDLP